MLKVNGKEIPVEPGITVRELLVQLGLEPSEHLVLRNQRICQPGDVLKDGDELKSLKIMEGG